MGQLAFDLPGVPDDSGAGGEYVPRLVHYLGGKSRLIKAIEGVVQDVAPSGATACDLFSGSGVVSAALAESRFVVAVDIQEYARILASALLHSDPVDTAMFDPLFVDPSEDEVWEELLSCFEPLIQAEQESIEEARRGDPNRLADLIEAGSLISLQIDGPSVLPGSIRHPFQETLRRLEKADLDRSRLSTTSRYFGGLFFGFRQAIQLDVLLSQAEQLPAHLQDIGRAAILSTASTITPTVGSQFAQPLRPRNRQGRPKAGLWKRVADGVNSEAVEICRDSLTALLRHLPTRYGGKAMRADYRDFLESWSEEVGVFYIDPPYTRDHYSRFYHVLETLCLRDNPEVSRSNLGGGARISRGAYRTDRHQSPFCIRSKAPEAFETLFRLCRKFEAPVVLSYSPSHKKGKSRPRVMCSEKIEEIARRYFPRVAVERVEDVAHNKLTKTELHLETPELAEVLIICEP